MAWQQRGSQRYYYRGGGGRKAYLGRGAAAQLAAENDDARRVLDEDVRRCQEVARRQLLAADFAVRAFVETATMIAEGTLLVAGFHRHDRGEWRLRRKCNRRTCR